MVSSASLSNSIYVNSSLFTTRSIKAVELIFIQIPIPNKVAPTKKQIKLRAMKIILTIILERFKEFNRRIYVSTRQVMNCHSISAECYT